MDSDTDYVIEISSHYFKDVDVHSKTYGGAKQKEQVEWGSEFMFRFFKIILLIDDEDED